MSPFYQERLLKVIVAPLVSEKVEKVLGSVNQFGFKVMPNATKKEIKDAIEYLFSVKVKHVRVLNVKGKRKTFGRIQGKRPNWKKAYICLEEGHDIRFYEL